jgi:hypothetical protein
MKRMINVTVAAMIVTIAIARWKRSMTTNGPAAPAAAAAGLASHGPR